MLMARYCNYNYDCNDDFDYDLLTKHVVDVDDVDDVDDDDY